MVTYNKDHQFSAGSGIFNFRIGIELHCGQKAENMAVYIYNCRVTKRYLNLVCYVPNKNYHSCIDVDMDFDSSYFTMETSILTINGGYRMMAVLLRKVCGFTPRIFPKEKEPAVTTVYRRCKARSYLIEAFYYVQLMTERQV